MSENHIRAITTTLSLFDEDLCEFYQWAEGHAIKSVLHEVRNPLPAVQRKVIAERVERMLKVLKEIKDTLDLSPSVHMTDKMIVGTCAIEWASLVELESNRLRRYGEVPPGLGEYLDPKVKALNEDLRVISNAAGESLRRRSRESE
jgi:hypothetical protein